MGTTSRVSPPTDRLSRLVERFDELSTFKALGLCLIIAVMMIAWIYQDFVFGDAVLLFTDIGSDAVNMFYPLWMQQSQLWVKHATVNGFSLETVMGMPTTISMFDIFQWIVILGGPQSIPESIVMAEIAKSIAISVFAFHFFSLIGLRNVSSLVGSLCFAFAGYVALGATGWYVLSSAMVYVVLSLWLTEYALNRRSMWFIVSPLAMAFVAQVSGYLLIYLTAALLVYTLIRVVSAADWRPLLSSAGSSLGSIAVGLLVSYSAIDATVENLTNSGRAEALRVVEGGALSVKKDRPITQVVDRIELMNVVQRAYSTNALGVGNAFKGMGNFLEAPLLYMGIPMLLFLPLYGMGRNKREKLFWGAMLAAVLMMLIFPWFRYAFWGFKLDYFREFTMLIGSFLLILAMKGLDGVIASPTKARSGLIISASVMLLLPFVFAKPVGAIDPSQRMTSVVMLMLLSGSALGFVYTRRSAFLAGLVLMSVIDVSMNAHATITKRSFVTKADIRNGKLYGDASVRALKWIHKNDNELHRTVKYIQSGPAIHPSINDAMVQGFNGLIGYSSFHNKYYLKFMSELGCLDLTRPDESKWVSRIITRPFLASALGARYFVTRGPFGFQPEIFRPVHREQDLVIQRSVVSLPLLVAHTHWVTPDQFRELNQGRQDYMLYNAVVVNPADASGLPQFNLATDTVTNVTPMDFIRAAEIRRVAMPVRAHATAKGLRAEATVQTDGIVVISVPYDTALRVMIDGKEEPTFVANFGFIGVKVPAGRHIIQMDRQ